MLSWARPWGYRLGGALVTTCFRCAAPIFLATRERVPSATACVEPKAWATCDHALSVRLLQPSPPGR